MGVATNSVHAPNASGTTSTTWSPALCISATNSSVGGNAAIDDCRYAYSRAPESSAPSRGTTNRVWNRAAPDEYGFYANVNPKVDHPRWSQASERRIGELTRRDTLPFNGYADEVASLYAGMDLRKEF